MQYTEIKDECVFLSPFEEEEIKLVYEQEKNAGKIDKSIIHILDNLNSIDGVATLYSCQGHLNRPRSYLVMKIAEEMTYPFTESVWELLDEYKDVIVNWETKVQYIINNKLTTQETVTLRGSMNYHYMNKLYNKLK